MQLVAAAANLVCRSDLHPTLVPLAARAAKLAHEGGDLLAEPNQFPSTKYVEWPLAPAARAYFESGPPFLQKYLPFWVAALVDRLKYLLLPLITLALPMMRAAPPLYVWRVRSRIYRWYRIVQELDHRIADRAAHRAGIGDVAARADETDSDDVARDMAVLRSAGSGVVGAVAPCPCPTCRSSTTSASTLTSSAVASRPTAGAKRPRRSVRGIGIAPVGHARIHSHDVIQNRILRRALQYRKMRVPSC